MRYIVNNEEVSRDTFYFCQKAKEENKSFVLLDINKDVDTYINKHPEYDYYIRNNISAYYTKGEAIITEWYEKDTAWYTATTTEMTKRYNRSKFKNTMTFTDWYAKNGWEYKSEIKYESKEHDIPTAECFYEEVQIKLFSVKVDNDDTVKTINEIKDKYGDCIEYVLRDNCYTEIIFRDGYKEI